MYPFWTLLTIFIIGMRNTLADGMFDFHVILDNAEHNWEHRLRDLLSLSYLHSPKTIQNCNPPTSNIFILQNQNHVKRSPRSEILLISNMSLLFSNVYPNLKTDYILVFTSHSLHYDNNLTRVITTSKIIFLGEYGIFIPCFPCRNFIFINGHSFSLDLVNSIWH